MIITLVPCQFAVRLTAFDASAVSHSTPYIYVHVHIPPASIV